MLSPNITMVWFFFDLAEFGVLWAVNVVNISKKKQNSILMAYLFCAL